MSDIPRKKLEELLALYTVEQGIFDIYAEGDVDAALLSWFVKPDYDPNQNVGIYAIDQIEVPSSLVCEYGFEVNNRGRVLALCAYLERHCGHDLRSAVGIIDSDFRKYVPEQPHSTLILVTDFSCLEMYFYNSDTLGKVLSLAFQSTSLSAHKVLEVCSPLLHELFLIRAVNYSMRLNLTYKDFVSFLSFDDSSVSLDRASYLRYYLSASGNLHKLQAVEQEIQILRSRFTSDVRDHIHGHDFLSIFGAWLKSHYTKTLDKERCRPQAVFNCLICAVTKDELAQYSMFRTLIEKIRAVML